VLLTDFVESLSAPAALSEATASQYRLFSMLETVARRYLDLKATAEAKTTAGTTDMTPMTANVARNEIDGYLHALGIVPTLQQHGGGGIAAADGDDGSGGGGGDDAMFGPEHHHDEHHHHHHQQQHMGMAAPGQHVMGGAAGPGMPLAGQNTQPSLEDWFYSGQQLMGLWEKNLF
jgi:hypothetical protein